MRLCEELVSLALSESPHIERLADAQHSARRGSQQLVLPATSPPPPPIQENKRGVGRRGREGGHAVKEDAVHPRRAMEKRDAAAPGLSDAGALTGSE